MITTRTGLHPYTCVQDVNCGDQVAAWPNAVRDNYESLASAGDTVFHGPMQIHGGVWKPFNGYKLGRNPMEAEYTTYHEIECVKNYTHFLVQLECKAIPHSYYTGTHMGGYIAVRIHYGAIVQELITIRTQNVNQGEYYLPLNSATRFRAYAALNPNVIPPVTEGNALSLTTVFGTTGGFNPSAQHEIFSRTEWAGILNCNLKFMIDC